MRYRFDVWSQEEIQAFDPLKMVLVASRFGASHPAFCAH